ncbi:MAG: hypothetical protein LBT42_08725 [Tannerella sp.]|jgi:hypothetical protein|nr:hypothetical protein [Tannerella sp.]
MSKFKKLRQLKIGNYFRELSVVIIGIAVTLYASDAITGAKEKEGMNIQMNDIYAELEFNLFIIDRLTPHFDGVDSLKEYLRKDYKNPGQGYADSLRNYIHVVGQTHSFLYKKGAYEMFLNSGSAKLFEDKTLLSGITECYAMMEMAKESVDRDMSLKMDMIRKLYDYDTEAVVDEDMDLKRPMYRSLYNYYMVSTGGGGESLKNAKESIEKALAQRIAGKKKG